MQDVVDLDGPGESRARRPSVVTWMRLARVYQKVQLRTQRHLRKFGLTTAQFDVLAHVGSAPGLTQQDLARRLLVTKGNVCGLVDRMEEAGLLERQSDAQDRRVHRLQLTSSGRRLYEDVVPAHEQLISAAFSELRAVDREALRHALRRLDPSLDARGS